jgi:hypothetical protein
VRIRGGRDLEAEWQWRNLLKDWDASGLSGAEYCRRKGITYSQFRDWRIEIRKRNSEIEEIEQKSAGDSVVEMNWREIIAEWRSSGLTGAEYCRRKQIIYWQLANWKQKISRLDAQAQHAAQKALARQQKSKAVKTQMKRSQANMDAAQHSVEFAEVKLTEHKQEVPNESNESHKVEIVLPTGIVVRLGDCTSSFLSSVISALEKH